MIFLKKQSSKWINNLDDECIDSSFLNNRISQESIIHDYDPKSPCVSKIELESVVTQTPNSISEFF